jgi:putative membrane protein
MRTALNPRLGVPLVLAPALLAMGAAPALAQDAPRYYGPHMMWDGGWWMLFGPLSMLLFLAALIAIVVLLVRWLTTGHGGSASAGRKMPLEILEERFARGEIDKEEFEERRRVLGR